MYRRIILKIWYRSLKDVDTINIHLYMILNNNENFMYFYEDGN